MYLFLPFIPQCLSRGSGGGALDEFVEQESEQDRVLKTLSSWWARPTTTADIAVGASSHAASINADSAAREDSLCVSGKAVAAFLKRKHGGDDAHRVHVVESGSKKKKQTLFGSLHRERLLDRRREKTPP